uniref:Putative secreted protein n=1 Tax=Ixodes ricinus TaxID=34613 RepID=A0A6B0V3Y4_IXORI
MTMWALGLLLRLLMDTCIRTSGRGRVPRSWTLSERPHCAPVGAVLSTLISLRYVGRPSSARLNLSLLERLYLGWLRSGASSGRGVASSDRWSHFSTRCLVPSGSWCAPQKSELRSSDAPRSWRGAISCRRFLWRSVPKREALSTGSQTPDIRFENGSPPARVCGVPGSLPDGLGGLSTTNRRRVSLGERDDDDSLAARANGEEGRKLFQWLRKSRLMLRMNWNRACGCELSK